MNKIVPLIQQRYARSFQKDNFLPFERQVYSQNGEDGIIEELFNRIGTDSKFAVEIGVEDGTECNTRYLLEQGWDVVQIDGADNKPPIKKAFVTAENINELFAQFNVPKNLDLLSIDIDSNDFWVWKALNETYRPRVIIMEYNSTIAPCYALSVKYDPKLVWDHTNYFGASLLALWRLGQKRGYELVASNDSGVNAFFVRSDLLGDVLVARKPADVYRPPYFGTLTDDGVFTGHGYPKKQFVRINKDLEAEEL